MKPWLWIALKTFRSNHSRAGASSIFALLGLALGVASLVVAMAAMSGFEVTLRDAVVDTAGHILVVKRGREVEAPKEFQDKIADIVPEVKSTIPFAMVEAVAAKKGKIKGIMIQGVDALGAQLELGFVKRIVEGEFSITSTAQTLRAVIGKAFATEMNLKVGDKFKVVLPLSPDVNPESLRRKMKDIEVVGIVDLGKYQFDSRYVITDIRGVQDFADLGDRYHGLIVKLPEAGMSQAASLKLMSELGSSYWIRDWQDDNIFEAVKMEKIVIFFVLLLMILLAAMNITSSLFIGVVQKFSDISILKAMGAAPNIILKVFCAQGLMVGFIGVTLGWVLGLILTFFFDWVQTAFGVIDGSVYRLDHIYPEIRFVDNVFVIVAALLICLVATLAPAYRGAKLKPVEGLRYE